MTDLDRRARATSSRPCRTATASASAWPRPSCTTRMLLILDEPTRGLDPVQIVEMRNDDPQPQGQPHGPGLQPHPHRDQRDLRSPAGPGPGRDLGDAAPRRSSPTKTEASVAGHGRVAAKPGERQRRGQVVKPLLSAIERRHRGQPTGAEEGGALRSRSPCERDVRADCRRALVGAGHEPVNSARDQRELENIFLKLVQRRRPCEQLASSFAASWARTCARRSATSSRRPCCWSAACLFQARPWASARSSVPRCCSEFFRFCSGCTMGAAIALCIRLIAEERQQHTMVLLNTSPVRDAEIIARQVPGGPRLPSRHHRWLSFYMPLLIKVQRQDHLSPGAGRLPRPVSARRGGACHRPLRQRPGPPPAGRRALALALIVIMLLFYPLAQKLDAAARGVFAGPRPVAHALPGRLYEGRPQSADIVYYLAVTYFFLFSRPRRWRRSDGSENAPPGGSRPAPGSGCLPVRRVSASWSRGRATGHDCRWLGCCAHCRHATGVRGLGPRRDRGQPRAVERMLGGATLGLAPGAGRLLPAQHHRRHGHGRHRQRKPKSARWPAPWSRSLWLIAMGVSLVPLLIDRASLGLTRGTGSTSGQWPTTPRVEYRRVREMATSGLTIALAAGAPDGDVQRCHAAQPSAERRQLLQDLGARRGHRQHGQEPRTSRSACSCSSREVNEVKATRSSSYFDELGQPERQDHHRGARPQDRAQDGRAVQGHRRRHGRAGARDQDDAEDGRPTRSDKTRAAAASRRPMRTARHGQAAHPRRRACRSALMKVVRDQPGGLPHGRPRRAQRPRVADRPGGTLRGQRPAWSSSCSAALNYEVKDLGLVEGLGRRCPTTPPWCWCSRRATSCSTRSWPPSTTTWRRRLGRASPSTPRARPGSARSRAASASHFEHDLAGDDKEF